MPRTRKKYPPQRRKKPGQLKSVMPAAPEIDPHSSCPPAPPGYSGNWYNDCVRILGIR